MERGGLDAVYFGKSQGRLSELAEPPYQVMTRDFLCAIVEFDPEAAAAALPPGLEPDERSIGLLALYSAPHGWGLAPYSTFFIGVSVKGMTAPDGSPAIFVAEGYFSGHAGQVFHERYNARLVPGWSRFWREGELARGEAGPGEASSIRISLRELGGEAPVATSGVNHYVGVLEGGEGTVYAVGFTARFCPAELVEFTVLPGASDLLRSLAPVRTPWASVIDECPVSISAPRPWPKAPVPPNRESDEAGLIDLLSRLPLAAALIGRQGRIAFANPGARDVLQGLMADGHLTGLPKDWSEGRGERPEPAAPFALNRREGLPLIAQVLPVPPALAGDGLQLVLFGDPVARAGFGVAPLLELLGLTPAEARIAAAMGAGGTTADVAQSLGLAHSTVRSTLKLVFQKLSVRRQSDLAQILACLAEFSGPGGPFSGLG